MEKLWFACMAALFGVFLFANIFEVRRGLTLPTAGADPADRIESLKALADWSKWLVSIDVFLAAASLYLDLRDGQVSSAAMPAIKLAGTSFILSVIAAGVLLGAIPAAIEQAKSISSSVYAFRQHGIIKLWTLAMLEHVLFIVGLLFLLPLLWRG